MDYQALLNLIEADSGLTALAEAGNCIGVAAGLNNPTIAVSVQYQLTALKVMDVLGPIRGTQVMEALRANPLFVEIVKLMDNIDAGVNLKHPESTTMFNMLVLGQTITQSESDALLGLRTAHIGLAEQELGQSVTHTDVANAWLLRGQ